MRRKASVVLKTAAAACEAAAAAVAAPTGRHGKWGPQGALTHQRCSAKGC